MPTILVIEDHDDLREVLATALTANDYEVIEASNGTEAMAALTDRSVDLIITDILMPEKDGLEVLMELKNRDAGIKVIAMSSGGHIGPKFFLDTARTLGAQRTFTKPFDMDKLLDAVRELISSSN